MSKEKIRTLLPYAFSIAVGIVFLVPIINIKPEWDVFMHPWRPETAASLLLLVFLGYGWLTGELGKTVSSFSRSEKFLIIAPIALFTIWSGMSALWANSLSSVIHHTGVWANYLGYYLVARWILARREARERFATGLCVFVLLLCVSPLIEFFTVSILSQTDNTLAARYSKYTELANTVLPLIAVFAIFSKGRSKILGYLAGILIGLFVVMSYSRTGVGMFVVVCTAVVTSTFLFPRFRGKRNQTILFVGLALAAGLTAALLPVALVERSPLVTRVTNELAAESTMLRELIWNVGIQTFEDNPLVGVGADNFGQEFVRYRKHYAEKVPGDINLSLGDYGLAERAHNEYIQIAAELGIVGILIVGVLVGGIIYAGIGLLTRSRRASPYAVAAFIGLAAFLSSSLVTSYSFRMIQNGIAFFIVLAVAIGGTFGRQASPKPSSQGAGKWGVLFAVISMLAVMLAAYSISRIVALQIAINGAYESDLEARYKAFDRAIAIDPANATLEWGYAKSLASQKRYREAAEHFQRAIDKGKATSIDYARMSIVQRLGGDLDGAEATIREALRAYPRSPFLYVRLAYILDLNGKHEESAAALNQAISLDKGQSLSWWNFMTNGGAVAAKEAFDQKLPPLMELKPREAVYAIMGEREVLHPEEKMNIPGMESPFSNND